MPRYSPQPFGDDDLAAIRRHLYAELQRIADAIDLTNIGDLNLATSLETTDEVMIEQADGAKRFSLPLSTDASDNVIFDTGILFNGDTAAANTLDDYEEGTWTPVLSDGTNNASTYTLQLGFYIKVGDKVTANCYVTTSNIGSVSGSLRIEGLPFTVSATTGNYAVASAGLGVGFAVTAGVHVSGYAEINSTNIRMQVWDSATGTTAMQDTQWTADGSVMLSVTYFID